MALQDIYIDALTATAGLVALTLLCRFAQLRAIYSAGAAAYRREGVLGCASAVLRYPSHLAQMGRTMLAVLVNWTLGTSWVIVSGDYTPWALFMFIDIAAAAAIVCKPAGKVQAYIGLFYMLQIAAHIAFGVRWLFDIWTDPIFYLRGLTYIALAQLAALGVWAGGVWFGDLLHLVRNSGLAGPRRAGAADLRDAAK